MSRNYTRDHLKISVAKILQTLGWNSINSTPLEILTDILGNYMGQITRNTNSYANEFGCTQPNLDHLGLTFRDMGISVPELEEYVRYVNFAAAPSAVPKYPIPKEDHLNFLKPGSKEVVTRPVHIHEHLPPMNPLLEGNRNELEAINCKVEELEDTNPENSQVFKKPADISPSEFKRPSFRREEEGSRPTREISSVMMTTSGFLSPAREGKLPESRTPISSIDPMGPVNPPQETIDLNKKPTKVVKKVEKKKFKQEGNTDPALAGKNRINSMKCILKSKQQQKAPNKVLNPLAHDISQLQNKANQAAKISKTLAAARLKTEKLNTTITPIPMRPNSPQVFPPEHDNVDKLFTEPDKKKVNIFKKISNVKNEKTDVKIKKDDIKQESRESSPDLIIDEPDEVLPKFTHLSSDVTIEPINSSAQKSPEKMDTPYFDDDSQPGTPSTPKTPEMISHSPPIVKEKRKRKDSKKIKRIQKNQSPHRLDNDTMDMDMERPKTPEAQVLPKMEFPPTVPVPIPNHAPLAPIPFPFNFGGPGLIPTPLANPLIPPLPFPPMNLYNFGQKPHLSSFHQKIEPPPPSDVHVVEDSPSPPGKLGEKPLSNDTSDPGSPSSKLEKKNKEHKKEKKDKIKKRNKKDKIKNKAEKKKLKEEKKEKIKKEKKEKRNKEKELKEGDSPGVKITLKLKSPSPSPEPSETRKLNIKPIVKKEEEDVVTSSEDRVKRETSPGLAKISALVCGPPKPKPVNPPKTVQPAFNDSYPSSSSDNFVNQTKKTMLKPIPKIRTKEIRREIVDVPIVPPAPPSRYIDADGNEVWICPGCGSQDDGSPMIGCDGCDAWYHWVCVGIQVPPDDSEDWYCRHCLLKKNEDLQSDKQKKKRKKKEKKEHN
ncbi:transcription initiation factor TFIID subunit 3 isoform X1 [Tribolium castaneum]|uniref:transcription initiation factor TFIID subunit 3 isoform X1 n=1 Tax=Tribolium castaneum TaxID=7070 RepID=UPI0030FE3C9B